MDEDNTQWLCYIPYWSVVIQGHKSICIYGNALLNAETYKRELLKMLHHMLQKKMEEKQPTFVISDFIN